MIDLTDSQNPQVIIRVKKKRMGKKVLENVSGSPEFGLHPALIAVHIFQQQILFDLILLILISMNKV